MVSVGFDDLEEDYEALDATAEEWPDDEEVEPLTPEQRAAIGISDGLVRVSVGIEDAADIIADLEQALA